MLSGIPSKNKPLLDRVVLSSRYWGRTIDQPPGYLSLLPQLVLFDARPAPILRLIRG